MRQCLTPIEENLTLFYISNALRIVFTFNIDKKNNFHNRLRMVSSHFFYVSRIA